MSVPEELVQAAANAICLRPNNGMTNCTYDRRKHPECALTALFAALPRCEDVIMAVAKAMPHGWTDDDGVRHDDVSKGNYNTAKSYLAALAREFGATE